MSASLAFSQSIATESRKEKSPQWHNGEFVNPEPVAMQFFRAMKAMLSSHPDVVPKQPLPVQTVNPNLFRQEPASGLRMTWFGHSSFILELDGARILVDPVWSKRASPVSFSGPERWYEPLLPQDSLPHLDAIVISHDHYDHLDIAFIKAMAMRDTRFVVPLGVGDLLQDTGIPAERIVELDWWESTRIGDVTITATPARHASGRSLFGRNRTLWAGFALRGPRHNVFYSGDTGPSKLAFDIGKRLGPFDLAMVECGQYNDAWPDWHMTPEQTYATAKAVQTKALIPVHWGLFKLSTHAWYEPVDRVLAAQQADAAKPLRILVPRPGQSVEPESTPELAPWWHQH